MKTWENRIDEACERGFFTGEDRALAMRFETCAVGEKLWGRRPTHASRLWDLGLEFCQAVTGRNDVESAVAVYRQIRAADHSAAL